MFYSEAAEDLVENTNRRGEINRVSINEYWWKKNLIKLTDDNEILNLFVSKKSRRLGLNV